VVISYTAISVPAGTFSSTASTAAAAASSRLRRPETAGAAGGEPAQESITAAMTAQIKKAAGTHNNFFMRVFWQLLKEGVKVRGFRDHDKRMYFFSRNFGKFCMLSVGESCHSGT
jgi:hypothetical protein